MIFIVPLKICLTIMLTLSSLGSCQILNSNITFEIHNLNSINVRSQDISNGSRNSQLKNTNNSIPSNKYTFAYNSTIKDKFFKIKEIHPIDNQSVAILSHLTQTYTNTTITVYSGQQLQTKILQTAITADQQIKFSSKKLYLDTNTTITEQILKPIDITVNCSYLLSRYSLKDKYLYFQSVKSTDSYKPLRRVNIETGLQELVSLQYQNMVFYLGKSLIGDAGWKNIAYIKLQRKVIQNQFIDQLKMFIINTETRKTQYDLKVLRPIRLQTQLDYWYDAQTNQSKITIFHPKTYSQSSTYFQTFIFNHAIQKYEQVGYFNGNSDQNQKIVLTGFDEAVSYSFDIETNRIDHYIKNSKIALYRSDPNNETQQDKRFIGLNFITSSLNQHYLIMLQEQSQDLHIYQITSFSVSLLIHKIDIHGNHSSSIFSSDNETLFVFSSNLIKHPITIYQIRLQSQIIIRGLINEQPKDIHLCFAVFDSKYDRFLILIKRQTVKKENITIFQHHLQIRKVSDPQKVIVEYNAIFLDIISNYSKYKIITDSQYGLGFIIIAQKTQQSSDTYVCTIWNDTLEFNPNESKILSFDYTYVTSRYIINIVYPSVQRNPVYLGIHDKNNLSVINYIALDCSNQRYIIQFKGDTLLLFARDAKLFCRYELNLQISHQNFAKSSKLYDQSGQFSRRLIFLKNTDIQWIVSYTFQQQSNISSKIIFNASLPINKISSIPGSNNQLQQSAYISKNENSNLKCDTLIYLTQNNPTYNNSFKSFKNCEPYQEPNEYPIRSQGDKSQFRSQNLYKASTKHHILISSTVFKGESKFMRIQLRAIDRDFQILFQKDIPYQDSSFPYQYLDYTQDGVLIFKYLNNSSNKNSTISLITPQITNAASTYQIHSFINFSVNDLGSIAFVGQSLLSTPEKPIISITVVDKNKATLFHRNIPYNTSPFTYKKIKAITVDQFNTKLAFCYENDPQNITFLAWEFASPYDRILDMQVTGKNINQIKFIGLDKIFFDIDGQLQIAKLDFDNTRSFQSVRLDFPQSKLYAVNKNGFSFAFLNNNNLDIYDQNLTIVAQIQLQMNNSQIQAINFGIEDSLFLVDSNSTVTVFRIQNCSHRYTNQKGYCMCLRKYAQTASCLCYENFVDQEDGTCACIAPHVLEGDKCDCSSGWYAYYKSCQECSFWCAQCKGLSTSCTKYSEAFYGIVIGGSLMLIFMIAAGVWFVKNRNADKQKSFKGKAQKERSEHIQKSASDFLAEETLSKPFKGDTQQQFESID